MALPRAAEAVIIGGGINGGSIAFYLAQAGMKGIVVLEQHAVASGASSLGAGIIRTLYRHEGEARLAQLSLATYRNWAEEVGGSCGYAPTGFLWLVGQDGMAELQDSLRLQSRLGTESRFVSAVDIGGMQPHLGLDGIAGGAYDPHGGHGDPRLATEAFHTAAARLGARLFDGVRVQHLIATSGQITGVATSEGVISTPRVILAAGAWSAALAASVGIDLPVSPVRMTTGTIRHAAPTVAPMTFIDTVSDTFYRPMAEPGLAQVSVRDARHNTLVDPDSGWKHEVIEPAALAAAIRRLSQRIAGLAAKPDRAWAGIDGVTPDSRAILGETAGMDGLILAVGGSYKGFKVAPAIGRCLAELITTGRSRSVDLGAFSLTRFQTGSRPAAAPGYTLASVG